MKIEDCTGLFLEIFKPVGLGPVLDSQVGQALEDIEADMRSTITCRVCYKHAPVDGFTHVNVLSCGHAFCSLCAFTMVHCATCRAPVVGKFKLFL